ncbi:immunity 52 family protein [Microbacterium sp. cx-59]|uniref:immunity 52 family protein n=1 Tax=Microbacterium sp. cx-59 TaxID=2891207 RepID=UPI001E43A43A|nr:immunity 52 family protein [Microbacterium sp. cx-59]MCC4908961.1 immunity 52 family protein [Microbacterium sp. cx-59]
MTVEATNRWGLLFQAFWGAREEDSVTVARRLIDTLAALDGFRDAIGGRWVDASGHDVERTTQAAEDLVARSVPSSIDGRIFAEQGFSVVLVLVPAGESSFESRSTIRLTIAAGSAVTPRRNFHNTVFVDGTSLFPEQETFPLWPAAFAGLVGAWQPEHAALLSKEQRRVNDQLVPHVDEPWIGAITYLSDRAGSFPVPSVPARVDILPDGAMLSLEPDSPDDAVAGSSVLAVLEAASSDDWKARIPLDSGEADR